MKRLRALPTELRPQCNPVAKQPTTVAPGDGWQMPARVGRVEPVGIEPTTSGLKTL
ncbi:MAG: hypothetical protein KDB23_16290 [Planctomycetales bacterium]|nr:hypothetical protein [Planctomycetales bacterium]